MRNIKRQIKETKAKKEAGTLLELYNTMLLVYKELVDAV
jgi:hypothetical protein